jgi:hypothetical protein
MQNVLIVVLEVSLHDKEKAGTRKGGSSWQSQTNWHHDEILALIACKHNEHVGHKKKII